MPKCAQADAKLGREFNLSQAQLLAQGGDINVIRPMCFCSGFFSLRMFNGFLETASDTAIRFTHDAPPMRFGPIYQLILPGRCARLCSDWLVLLCQRL